MYRCKSRFLLCLLFLSFLFSVSAPADGPLTPTPEDIPEVQAISLATTALGEALGLSFEEIGRLSVTASLCPQGERRAWCVVFELPDTPLEQLAVYVDAAQGTVTEDLPPRDMGDTVRAVIAWMDTRDYVQQQTLLWEKTKGSAFLWSYIDKAVFCAEYGYAPGYSDSHFPGLPSEEDIPYAKAIAIAQAACEETYGLSRDAFFRHIIEATFYPNYPSSNRQNPAWHIALRTHDEASPEGYPWCYTMVIKSPSGEVESHNYNIYHDCLFAADHAQ